MKFELSPLQVWALGSKQMKVFFDSGYEKVPLPPPEPPPPPAPAAAPVDPRANAEAEFFLCLVMGCNPLTSTLVTK